MYVLTGRMLGGGERGTGKQKNKQKKTPASQETNP